MPIPLTTFLPTRRGLVLRFSGAGKVMWTRDIKDAQGSSTAPSNAAGPRTNRLTLLLDPGSRNV